MLLLPAALKGKTVAAPAARICPEFSVLTAL
jgi:hypothetical protein